MSAQDSAIKPSFEEAMQRLEQIVRAMESERLPLEDMLNSYEEGMRLLALCRQCMDHAKLRVEQIQSSAEALQNAPAPEAGKAARSGKRRVSAEAEDGGDPPPTGGPEIRLF